MARAHLCRAPAGDDERAVGAERDEDLGRAERTERSRFDTAGERLRLLHRQLQDRHVTKERGVRLSLEPQRPDGANARQSLPVE